MVKVSVVIPAFNEEKYIGKCLDSLLNQTYEDIELILIDDGSTDRTLEILKDYEKKHKRITVLTQDHKGPGEARNLGAKNAKGEILVFVDSDMEFDKDYVKILVEPILRDESVGTSHRHEHIANLDNIWARCWSIKKIDESEEVKYGGIFRAIKKDAFLSVGGFDPKDGFFDDGSLPNKVKGLNLRTNAKCYHNNPSSLKEVFRQAKWIGGSFVLKKGSISKRLRKFRYFIALGLIILLGGFIQLGPKDSILLIIFWLLMITLFFTLRRLIKEKFLPYLVSLPIFYVVKFSGLFSGAFMQAVHVTIKKMKHSEASYEY